MAYHETDLRRLNATWGTCWSDWALPVGVTIGGSGVHERGFSIQFLCFWFGLHWWPKEYAAPRRNDMTPEEEWDLRFKRMENDPAYHIEGIDIRLAEMGAMIESARNSLDVLRTKE